MAAMQPASTSTSRLAGRSLRYLDDPSPLAAPDWFVEHTGVRPVPLELSVDDATVRSLDWRPVAQTRQTLLFVHGGAANAQWWAPLAPFFVRDGHRVVAMDLSGMGVSDWRGRYGVAQWARDVAAVGRATATTDHPVVLVGHSLGGIVGAQAVTEGDTFARFVAVDSPVWNHAPAPESPVGDRADAPGRYYDDPEVPVGRFSLIPHQEVANRWYVRHVAWHGLTPTDAGWTWRFDRHIFDDARGANRMARFEGDLADARCPCAVVMGEESYLTPTALEHVRSAGRRLPLVLVPRARHHVMLDEPLSLVSALRGLLASW
jgi:pimeloyl-ACP methyl ester carboxylesterase